MYAIVLFFTSVVTYCSTFGIGQAAIYLVGKGRYPRSLVIGNTLIMSGVISLVSVMAGSVIVCFFSARFFPTVQPGFLWVGVLLIPLQLISGIMAQLVLSVQNIRAYNLARILKGVSTLVGFFFLLGVLRGSVFTALWIEILSSLFVCVVLGRILIFENGPLNYRVRLGYVFSALRFGFATYVGSTLLLLHYRIDVFMINLYLSASQVGLYSLSSSLAEKISFLSDSISTLLFPRLVSGEGDTNGLTPLVFRTVLFSLMGMGGILVVFGYFITKTLFGEAYIPSVAPLRILVIGTIAAGAWGILESDIKSRGFPLFGFATSFVSAVINIVLNWFWIPRYGIAGAASATAVSYLLSLVMGVFIYCHQTGQKIWVLLLPQKRDFLLYRDVVGRFWQGGWL